MMGLKAGNYIIKSKSQIISRHKNKEQWNRGKKVDAKKLEKWSKLIKRISFFELDEWVLKEHHNEVS